MARIPVGIPLADIHLDAQNRQRCLFPGTFIAPIESAHRSRVRRTRVIRRWVLRRWRFQRERLWLGGAASGLDSSTVYQIGSLICRVYGSAFTSRHSAGLKFLMRQLAAEFLLALVVIVILAALLVAIVVTISH